MIINMLFLSFCSGLALLTSLQMMKQMPTLSLIQLRAGLIRERLSQIKLLKF